MKKISIVFLLTLIHCAVAEDAGFLPLFNGANLNGWVNINGAPETWSVTNGMIHCTGHPTGAMRTQRQYENFILEADWRHLSAGGNSGIFIWGGPLPAPGVPYLRGIEVQVLDNGFAVKGKNEWYTTHGDIFPIHGAKMKPIGRTHGDRAFPSEERSKSSPEWNHYRIVCTNGTIRLSVNGKEVSGGDECNYRKGYLALESEGGPVEFRNLRIKELPSTDTPAELTAPLDQGWQCLFNGLDLRGWKKDAPGWRVSGGHLVADATGGSIVTEPQFGNAEFILDCRLAKGTTNTPAILFQGVEIKLDGAESGKYRRFILTVNGQSAALTRDGTEVSKTGLPANLPARSPLELRARNADFFNLFVRDL